MVKILNTPIFCCLLILLICGCRSSYQAKPHDFPKPVDTTDRPIELQTKKVYQIAEKAVFADNLFDGARLNDFQHLHQDTFQARILPENKPINRSPYYAFRLWSSQAQKIVVALNYPDAKHRYSPKISSDGINWTLLDTTKVQLDANGVNAFLQLDISTDTLWVAAQELQNSTHVKNWCLEQAKLPSVTFQVAGKSKQGRDMLHLDINQGEARKKDIIAIISRQHPPEVTGYLAMKAFIEEILADTPLSNDFRKKYHLLVYPLMNPDGVDLGHWRHNTGGIDLNRDWAYYHQPEVKQVANHIVKTAKQQKAEVILGIDFHSTWFDVLYTNSQPAKNLPRFKDYWVAGFREVLSGEKVKESPSAVGAPVSKGWFLTQLDAEGIVYEVGDETPRDLIKKKGRTAAIEMMELLIFK